MRHLLIFLINFLSGAVSYAQTVHISGTVADEQGKPVVGATVSLRPLNRSVATDDNGLYGFQKIGYGTHTLEIRSLTTELKVISVNITATETVFNVIVNEKSEVQLDEVQVIGKSEKRLIEENGFAVNVIATKGLDLQSIQTNELLDRSAGVRIRQNGGLGSQIQYNINGLSGNSVRILIDGIPISSYGESFSLNSIPASLIDRIEVYKGVVPAHLADDALGGAINVVLKQNVKNGLSTAYSFGSFNTHQWNLTGNYRDSKSHFTTRASAFYNYTDNNYKVWGDNIYVTDSNNKLKNITAKRFNDAYYSLGGKLDLGFTDLKWADQLMVGIVYSNMEKEVQHGATMEAVYGNRRYNQNTKLYNLTYSKSNLLVKGLDLSLFASYSELERGTIDTNANMYDWNGSLVYQSNGQPYPHSAGAEAGAKTLQTNNENKYVSRSNLSYSINSNHKVSGSYLYDNFTREQDDPLLATFQRELTDTRYLSKNIFSFSYDVNALQDKLKANLFYKYYNLKVKLKDPVSTSNRPGTAPTYEQVIINRKQKDTGYGLALSYQLSAVAMLTASAEQAIRLPSSMEIFGNSAENITPAYNLVPESSLNMNLGINLGPFSFNEHRLNTNVNFFTRDVKDMIRQGIPSIQSETFSFENLENVTSKGVDAELRYTYKNNFHVILNGSVFDGRFNTKYNQNGAVYGHYRSRLRNEPYFTQNSNIRYDVKNMWQKNSKTSFYYNLGYVHHFYRGWEAYGGNNKADIPTQLVHDAGFAYTFPQQRFVISVDAKNILNRQVFDNWALQKAGRAFYAKINYIIR